MIKNPHRPLMRGQQRKVMRGRNSRRVDERDAEEEQEFYRKNPMKGDETTGENEKHDARAGWCTQSLKHASFCVVPSATPGTDHGERATWAYERRGKKTFGEKHTKCFDRNKDSIFKIGQR